MSDDIREVIRAIMPQLTSELPDADKKRYEDLFIKMFCENQSPKEAMGISSEMLEHMYAFGYRLYNLGQYKQAATMFKSLTVYDPRNARYAFAMAATCHRAKNLKDASKYYLRASQINLDDPMPLYFLYDCYHQSGLLDDAKICLEEGIRRMSQNPVFSGLREKCQLFLNNLNQEIAQL